jgi:hypothetical protein
MEAETGKDWGGDQTCSIQGSTMPTLEIARMEWTGCDEAGRNPDKSTPSEVFRRGIVDPIQSINNIIAS